MWNCKVWRELDEIEYSQFQGEITMVEGAYGFNGSIYNIPPKEVVRMIAFMGILLVLFVMLETLWCTHKNGPKFGINTF